MAIHQTPTQRKTVKRVMHEYKHGELKTARGARKVRNPKQAIAIALSEAGASKYDTPQERAHNLRRTKTKEKRGETAQAATEGRARAARTLAMPSKSATKSTRRTSAGKSTAGKSTAGKSTAGKSTARKSGTRKSATATRRKSVSATQRKSATRATARKPAARASAARSATRTTARKSAGKATARKSAPKATARRAATKTTVRRSANGKAGGKTRTELYAEASRRTIAGRSRMNKQQLERALRT
jgi:hypothetical protein